MDKDPHSKRVNAYTKKKHVGKTRNKLLPCRDKRRI